jgi:hypothetical protein
VYFRLILRVKYQLDKPFAVAEVYEYQIPVVTVRIDPACKYYSAALMTGAELAA